MESMKNGLYLVCLYSSFPVQSWQSVRCLFVLRGVCDDVVDLIFLITDSSDDGRQNAALCTIVVKRGSWWSSKKLSSSSSSSRSSASSIICTTDNLLINAASLHVCIFLEYDGTMIPGEQWADNGRVVFIESALPRRAASTRVIPSVEVSLPTARRPSRARVAKESAIDASLLVWKPLSPCCCLSWSCCAIARWSWLEVMSALQSSQVIRTIM